MTELRRVEHPDKPQMGDDEDYVEYLTRLGDQWSQHPPAAPDGFYLMECGKTPRHFPTYAVLDGEFYEGVCPSCQYEDLAARHDGCAHSHHRVWRRWKLTGKAAGWLYSSGITSSGGSWHMGGGCMGCYTMPKFNRHRRVYILWVQVETWRCLLKYHHIRGDAGWGMCGKCFPCPSCQSTTDTCVAGCPEVSF